MLQFRSRMPNTRIKATSHDRGRLFELVANDIAARSFSGKEVVLLTSNIDGLPMSVNLIANLAQFGHQHSLLLADSKATCDRLVSATPPACVWSSMLSGQYPEGVRVYIHNRIWVLWLQRYAYVHRLIRSGYNVLLVDTDVILFHDPYPFFKGVFENYTLITLGDTSAGYASVNGGVYYVQNARMGGPVVHIFSEFER